MNWDQVEGNWENMKGKVRETWGKLTDDDLTIIKGKKEQLAGRLKERYGYMKDRAETEIDSFIKSLESDQGSTKQSVKNINTINKDKSC